MNATFRTARARLAAAALGLLLAACASAPQEKFYTLAAPDAPAAAAAAAAAASIYVGPVTVPDAVDRIPMVIRATPNRVEIADEHRWAEPLKTAIPRVVGETLRQELGTPRVMTARLAATQAVDYRVAIEVQRFESSLQAGAMLDALWTVTPARGEPRTGRSTLAEPAPSADPAGIAAAHSRALARLAREIAAAIRETEGVRARPGR